MGLWGNFTNKCNIGREKEDKLTEKLRIGSALRRSEESTTSSQRLHQEIVTN